MIMDYGLYGYSNSFVLLKIVTMFVPLHQQQGPEGNEQYYNVWLGIDNIF